MKEPKSLLLFPLKKELQFFKDSFLSNNLYEKMSFEKKTGFHISSLGISLFTCGHGKVQSAITTQYLLDRLTSVKTVFCIGAAGGLMPEIKIGDIVFSIETIEHDYKEMFTPNAQLPFFKSCPETLKKIQSIKSDSYKTHIGRIASGDEDIVNSQRALEVHKSTQAMAVAWEGAGVARAARFNETSFVECRAITDSANQQASSDFEKNLRLAMSHVSQTLLHFF